MLIESPENDIFFDNLPIFCDLTPTQLAAARAVMDLVRAKADQVLMSADTAGDEVYIIAEGSVRIYAASDFDDGDMLLGLRGPGEVLGEMSVLDGLKRSATVVTQEPTVLFRLTRADFWEVLWEMPPIPYNLVRSLTRRTRVLTSQVQAFSALDVQGRLARQLIALSQEYGQPYPEKGARARIIPFQLKQAEIAAMIGATREQVNQLLSAWLRRGLIARNRVRNAHLVVCDEAELRKFYQRKS